MSDNKKMNQPLTCDKQLLLFDAYPWIQHLVSGKRTSILEEHTLYFCNVFLRSSKRLQVSHVTLKISALRYHIEGRKVLII